MRGTGSTLLVFGALLLAAGCGSARPKPPKASPLPDSFTGFKDRGIASWYGEQFHGRPTASGEIYDMHAMTAAHRTLPFGTRVRVTNLDNGRRIELTINDRGPFIRGRILDVSYSAARELGMIGPGTARVEIQVLGGPLLARRKDREVKEREVEDQEEPKTLGEALAERTFTVQIGAFQDPARAQRLRAAVGRRFPAAAVRSEGVWHRVQIGVFASRDAAEELLHHLLRHGYPALVVALP